MHPIEAESYRIISDRVDISGYPVATQAIVARVLHATADPELAASLVAEPASVQHGASLLAAGAHVVCDVEMLRAGIPSLDACCHLADAAGSPTGYPTRSATGIRLAGMAHPRGAVFAVACAPSALTALMDLIEDGTCRPELVVALPVGFVGAAQAKQRALGVCAEHSVPIIANRGERGGSAAGAAVLNALRRMSPPGLPGLPGLPGPPGPQEELAFPDG